MNTIENVTRPTFPRRRVFGRCVRAGRARDARELFAQAPAARSLLSQVEKSALRPSIYLGIEPDGTVYIVTHRSEMGTGIRTTLPIIAADELDADWSKVKIEQGIGDARYGDQNTDGSKSIRDFYDAFRLAGASARTMLVSAAAAQWGVPVV